MTYQVKAGVDLWLLAGWFYGDPSMWDVIYYGNMEVIGDDPEDLTPGMMLEIPEIETSIRFYTIPTGEEEMV